MTQGAFPIVRQRNHRIAQQHRGNGLHLALQRPDRRLALHVDPKHLLAPCEYAQFYRRRQPGVHLQAGLHSDCRELAPDGATRFIVTDDANHADLRAQRSSVPCNVRRTAQPFILVLDQHYRHGCLRGDPTRVAEPIAVKHDIPYHQQSR
ncbi:hypothetical protein D3C72_1652050 [compost metagenome]